MLVFSDRTTTGMFMLILAADLSYSLSKSSSIDMNAPKSVQNIEFKLLKSSFIFDRQRSTQDMCAYN